MTRLRNEIRALQLQLPHTEHPLIGSNTRLLTTEREDLEARRGQLRSYYRGLCTNFNN